MQHQAVTDHIVKWLREYRERSGMKGFVVGISGGIDSALTSTLCALTGSPTLLLSMPIHQHKAELDRAHEHMKWLSGKFNSVSVVEQSLTDAFLHIEKSFPADIRDPLTMANTRSRLRMLTLYAFAGNKKLLVAGTGNKVEDFGVGFFTKYGDGGVDISPIADLMKSEVRALAEHLGVVSSILEAQPTDGLYAESRTDESQIGASYDELEWAMAFEKKKAPESGLSVRQKEVLDIYRNFNSRNRHKMESIPVCMIPQELKTY